jgi:hypothetical protein
MRANRHSKSHAWPPAPDSAAAPFGQFWGAIGRGTLLLALLFATSGPASGLDGRAAYPTKAPTEQYRIESPSEEISLVRSAAPASISNDADVMVLGAGGYETAVKGNNGFVCLVERSWAASFDDAEFWNSRIRSPICFTPAAVRSVLPALLERTRWVLAGIPKADMLNRTKASAAANKMPEPGSIGYMMSKRGYLSDADGHWHPHLMFFEPRIAATAVGANRPGSPVLAADGGPEPVTVLLIPVLAWSDGTSAATDQQ